MIRSLPAWKPARRGRRRRPAYWLRLLVVGLVGGGLLGYLASIALYIELTVRSAPNPACCALPAAGGLPFEPVSLAAPGGLALDGWYLPSQNRAAVILLHGQGGSREQMLPQAEMLARHGYGLLLYDLRHHGRSGGEVWAVGWPDADDVQAALAFLQRRPDVDPRRVGILGFSVGGQVALRAAARMPGLRAVAADGPALAVTADAPPATSALAAINHLIGQAVDWGFELRTGVPAPAGVSADIGLISPRPLLLIATGADPTELHVARRYYSLAGQPKSLWEIPTAGHGGGPAAQPAAYEARLVDFFAGLLSNPSP